MQLINLFDYEVAARQALPEMDFNYFASGAFDEVTMRENRDAFDRIFLSYRVLVNVAHRDLSTVVLGRRMPLPFLVAPMAFQSLAHKDGEIAMVKACGDVGATMVVSTLSTYSIEEVAKAAKGPIWFQLYAYKDRSVTEALIERAEEAGSEVLVLTVDAPLLSVRERDVRNRFHLPPGITAKNLIDYGLDNLADQSDGSTLQSHFADLRDPSMCWDDIAWLRSKTRLPLVLKGVIRPEDAVRAAETGCAGVIVSNHGGRQLDSAPATITVLPRIKEAVGDRIDLLMDGGIRRGTDLVKALALGAKAVLVGRPALWGLAVGGADGVSAVLNMLKAELDLAMALTGCPTTADIGGDLILKS